MRGARLGSRESLAPPPPPHLKVEDASTAKKLSVHCKVRVDYLPAVDFKGRGRFDNLIRLFANVDPL